MIHRIILENNECILISAEENDNLKFQLCQIDSETRELKPIDRAQVVKFNIILSSLGVEVDSKDDTEEYIKTICYKGYNIGITMKNGTVRYSLYDEKTMTDLFKTESLERLEMFINSTVNDFSV